MFSLRGLGSKRLLSLDWDDRVLRMVWGRTQQGRLRNVRSACISLPADLDRTDAAGLGRFIRECLKRHKVGAQSAVVDIPRDQAILNTLTLPRGPEAELPAAVHFQIVKELPFSLDQAVVDFAVGDDEQAGDQLDVLVAAVRKDVLTYYCRVAEEAGLRLERVGLRPYANLVAVMHAWPDSRQGRVLVVDVGPSLTEIDVLREGRLVFSRAASVRVRDANDESWSGRAGALSGTVTDLMLEVTRSLEAYRVMDPGAQVDGIVVAGATGIEAELSAAMQERFATDSKLYEPGELVVGGLAEQELRGLSAAIGLALGHSRPGRLQFDFVHPKQPVDLGAIRARKIRVGAIAAIVVAAVSFLGAQQHLNGRDKVLGALRQQVAESQKRVKDFDKFKKQVEAASDWGRAEVVWLEHLQAITELFPDNKQAYATKLSLKDNGQINIALRMTDGRTSSKLAGRLQEAGYRAVPGPSPRQTSGRYPAAGSVQVWFVDQEGKRIARSKGVGVEQAATGERRDTPELAAGPNRATNMAGEQSGGTDSSSSPGGDMTGRHVQKGGAK